MFNFSGNKKNQNKIVVTDKVWISEIFKWKNCLKKAKEEKAIIAVWFDDTLSKLQTFFSNNNLPPGQLFIYRELTTHNIKDHPLIFAEHHPLLSKEQELYERLGLYNVTVYSSLDEPFLMHFGGDKIINLVRQMGMNEEEVIEHPMITSSIKNAQKKIGDAIGVEQSALSQKEWLLYNLL